MSANDRWREDLASWAIPQEILDAAPESPHWFPVGLFARRADRSRDGLTPSNLRALEALLEAGSVLDVGCGAGAASLPLAERAGELIGVDSSTDMLEAFRQRAEAAGVGASTVEGAWPEVADRAPVADVVVCHHVFYNSPDLASFALALTDHARVRVVVELTEAHPLSAMNSLWRRFHGIERPERPTADEAVEVLREAGIETEREDWTPREGIGFDRMEDLVAWVRRRLCLPADRDPEVAEAIAPGVVTDHGFGFGPRPNVTLWWTGSASQGTARSP
jgi:SAM-dependent methyltransferase